MEKVQFPTNTPVTLALKYATGKPSISQIDGSEQIRYTTVDDRVFYAYPALAAKIDALNLRAGEEFVIAKMEIPQEGQRPRIEWQVNRPEQASRPAPAQRAGSTLISETSGPQQNTNRPVPVQIPMDQAMTLLLIAAGRSTAEAEKALGQSGASIRFDSRDVAALATTMLIHSAKEGWLIAPAVLTPTESVLAPATGPAPAPEKPAEAVAQKKIAQLAEQARSNAPSAGVPWTTRGEMKTAFQKLRERIGETRWAAECASAQIADPSTTNNVFRYSNDALAFYGLMNAIANKAEAA